MGDVVKVLIVVPAELRDAARAQFDALSKSGNAGRTFRRGASATGEGEPTHYLSAPADCGPVTLASLPALKLAYPGSDYWLPPNGEWDTQAAFEWLLTEHGLKPVE